MTELTILEISMIRERLTRPDWVRRMQQLQDIVYRQFEDFRQQTDTLTVRAVVPRSEIKQLSHVIAKIERNREDGKEFGFEDIDDFIGIKVLCPYSTDADIVIEWMLAQAGFEVHPRDALEVVDRQSELLKQQIIETEFEEARRKAGVVQVYLRENQDVFQRLVQDGQVSADVLSGVVSEKDASILAHYVSQNRRPETISASLCRTAALLALQAKGQRFFVLCIDVCDDFIRSQPTQPRGHLVRASVAWAFDHLDEAITETQKAIAMAEQLNDEALVSEAKSNLAYWLAEKIWTMRRRKQVLPAGLVGSAFANIDYGLTREPASAAFLDTKGFLTVVAAEDRATVEHGRSILREAVTQAAGKPEEGIAQAFHARHDRIALMRLLEFS